jgi:hypothetical protein
MRGMGSAWDHTPRRRATRSRLQTGLVDAVLAASTRAAGGKQALDPTWAGTDAAARGAAPGAGSLVGPARRRGPAWAGAARPRHRHRLFPVDRPGVHAGGAGTGPARRGGALGRR